MFNPFRALRQRTAYYVAALLDSIVGDDPDPEYSRLDQMDGLEVVTVALNPVEALTIPVRDATPIYDNLIAEKLADQRAVMAPLLSTENLARLVEDGRVDADLYEDLLDALCVKPEQVWEMFEVETGADS